MGFNFNSYGNSNQTISYCEVDKCKAVSKLKECLQEIKSLCYEQDLNEDFFACEVLQKISEVE